MVNVKANPTLCSVPITSAASFALGILMVPSNNWIKMTWPLSYEIIVYLHQAPETTAKIAEVEHKEQKTIVVWAWPHRAAPRQCGETYTHSQHPFSSFPLLWAPGTMPQGLEHPSAPRDWAPHVSTPCAPPALSLWGEVRSRTVSALLSNNKKVTLD